MNVDDGLENNTWTPSPGGREVAHGVLRSSLPNVKKGLFLAIAEESRNFVVCFLDASRQMLCIGLVAGARHVSPAVV